MREKRFNLGVISVLGALLAMSIAFMGGCTKQSSTGDPSLPVPSTTPVTPGYIQSYDHKLGYGFEYPEDWKVHSPEEVTPGGGIEEVEMFTKKGEGTSITIIVKSTSWTNLEEVKKLYGEIHPLKILLKEDIIEVNGREGYEIIYKSPPTKTREVVFLANGKAYTIGCAASEDLYAASEEIFDHVIDSFIIK
jgi:hypothetical protein